MAQNEAVPALSTWRQLQPVAHFLWLHLPLNLRVTEVWDGLRRRAVNMMVGLMDNVLMRGLFNTPRSGAAAAARRGRD